jgi:hypothetical protein
MTIASGPEWATWRYNEKHLPTSFHLFLSKFESLISWIKTSPYCSPIKEPYPQYKAVETCLAIGLALRDIEHIQFTREDELEEGLPAVLQQSVLEWAHCEILVQRCHEMELNLKHCLKTLENNETNELVRAFI